MLGGRLTGLQLLICIFVAVGSTTFGFCGSVIGSTLSQPSFQAKFGLDGSAYATRLTTGFSVSFFCGGLLGATLLPQTADRWGRKSTLYFSAVLAIISGGLAAGSVNAAMFIIARFLTGIACGSLFAIAPLYQSEIAPSHLRGLLVGCHGTMFCAGASLGQWVNVGFFYVSGDQVWRPPLALQCFFPLVLLIGLRFIPESPRYLLQQGREDEARAVLMKVHAGPTGVSPELVELEFQAIVEAKRLDEDSGATYMDLIRTPSMRKRLLLCVITTGMYGMTGINVVAQYYSVFLQQFKLSAAVQLFVISGITTYAPIGNAIGGLIIDKMGRRRMLVTALAICSIGLSVTTAIVLHGMGAATGRIFGILAIFFYTVGFTTFYDVPCFAFCSEVWPQHLRAKGFSVAMIVFFTGNTVSVGFAPTAFENIGVYTFLIFTVPMVIAGFAYHFYWPETKGVSLEAMGALFGDPIVDDAELATGIAARVDAAQSDKGFEKASV